MRKRLRARAEVVTTFDIDASDDRDPLASSNRDSRRKKKYINSFVYKHLGNYATSRTENLYPNDTMYVCSLPEKFFLKTSELTLFRREENIGSALDSKV